MSDPRTAATRSRLSPGRREFAAVLAVLPVLAVVISGCAPETAGTSSESSTPSSLAGYPVDGWEACALPGQPDRRCGSVRVGSGAAEDATTFQIAIAVTPARKPDGQSRGPLIIDTGGPMSSGIAAQAGFAATAPDELRDDFDIVGYDRRGFGLSSPVDCEIGEPPVFDAADLDAQWAAFVPGATEDVEECAEKTEDRVLHAGIRAGVRDLEAVRAAVDAEEINMLTISYGTLLGQAYLSEHPDRVRTMIFDGTVDPDQSGPRHTLDGELVSTDAAAGYGSDREVATLPDGFVDAYEKVTDVYAGSAPYAQDLAYACTDFAWPVSPLDATTELTTEELAQAATTRGYCFGWPDADPVGELTYAEDAPRPLMFNGTEDLRTPIDQARSVADDTDGVLVTMPGPYHGLVNNFTCPTDIATAYLLTAELPAASECPKPEVRSK